LRASISWRACSPTDRVSITCTANTAFAIAISGGKATAAETVPATGLGLTGQAIDSVVVYAMLPSTLRICVLQSAEPETDAASWATADVLATGLTLPLRETDPSLATPAVQSLFDAHRARLRRRDPEQRSLVATWFST
jgi:hypothetical protein